MSTKLVINLADYKHLEDKARRKQNARYEQTGDYEKTNYFDRKKSLKRPYKENQKFGSKELSNVYFDTETFEFYKDKDDVNEIPIIIPYAIGICTDDTKSYKDFIGLDAVDKFLDYLVSLPIINKAALHAFNLDYDFHAIRPYIYEKNKDWLEMIYAMTDAKKFIYGGIRSKDLRRINRKNSIKRPKVDIKFVDLGHGDKSQSLRSYTKNILKITYNTDGSVKQDEIAAQLHTALQSGGFDQQSFKKLEIDYRKVNLHQEGTKGYYGSSKEDGINNINKKELDLSETSLERQYLKVDVTTLPIIALEQRLMRQLALKTVGIENPIDKDCYISVAGFAKYLCEEYEKKYMTETYRVPVSPHDYEEMLNSYTGAFTAANKDITYIDKEIFSKMYPGISFYDAEGNARIKSYDVNSMYPTAMSMGLPYGTVGEAKPKGKHVTGYEIEFTDYIDPSTKTVYKGKPQYAYLNNSFGGDKFTYGLIPGAPGNNKVFVLKELYELFISMNDVKCRIVKERYQSVSYELKEFVEKLYLIKRNDDKQYSDSQVALVKLILNSLYGKMAEKFRMHKNVGSSSLKAVLLDNGELFEKFEELGIDVITEETSKKRIFKSNISPHIDIANTSGFYLIESKDKRFDVDGEECRESITAGIFITSISRGMLLSAIKAEIDQGNVLLYCDTDSIKLIELKPPKFQCHDKDLGAWKFEGDYHYFGHPAVKKKYFMFNPTKPVGDKKRWMVKSSGFDDGKLRLPGAADWEFMLIKHVYDPNKRVIIKDSKPNNKRNRGYQIVIGKTDYKFTFPDRADKATHYVKDGVLYEI